jgi:hypothetical protein
VVVARRAVAVVARTLSKMVQSEEAEAAVGHVRK